MTVFLKKLRSKILKVNHDEVNCIMVIVARMKGLKSVVKKKYNV